MSSADGAVRPLGVVSEGGRLCTQGRLRAAARLLQTMRASSPSALGVQPRGSYQGDDGCMTAEEAVAPAVP